MKRWLFNFFFLLSVAVQAQQGKQSRSPADSLSSVIEREASLQNSPADSFRSLHSISLPYNYDGSGTSWQPEENFISAAGLQVKKTSFLFSGNMYLRYTNQDISNQGSRGNKLIDAPNWIMAALRRSSGRRGLISFVTMFSLDPLTEGSRGYPLLLQTGETNNTNPLVDRQHPNDFIMALATNYTYSLSHLVDVSLTAGYPYEPALGPSVYMHRLSAFHNPDAPVAYHWQDATHISYGVGTVGLRVNRIHFEGSIFNGREPDDHRFNFDSLRLDSYSFRFSWNPVHTLSMQISRGFLHRPEASHPADNITRSTFSILHTRRLFSNSFISSSFVIGVNDPSRSPRTRSLLLESTFTFPVLSVYGRYEFVQKAANELALVSTEVAPVYDNHIITLGLNKNILVIAGLQLSAGVQAGYLLPDSRIRVYYGNNPLSGEVYLQLSPPLISN